MRKEKIIIILFVIVFVVASLLRISLAMVNRDANDNHFKVIRIIANENRIPNKEEFECLQCYHPKLYHFVAAKTINLFFATPVNKLTDLNDSRKIISQMINVLAGILTLFVVFKFLKKLMLSLSTQLLTFSLIALNPALIGINAQATNDSFVILFSTSAIFFLFSFLKNKSWTSLGLLSASVILASLSKGSGIIIFLGILIIFFLKIISELKNIPELKKQIFATILFFVTCFPAIAFIGPYSQYYSAYGTPFVINKPKSAFPDFIERTYEGDKTGITSIYDAFFTFRFFDLLENPYLNRETDPEKYSLNRMSVWTQLFARNNFIQFEGHPKQWAVKLSNPIYNLGKIIFIFSLVPLTIFVFGIFFVTKKTIIDFWKEKLAYFSKNCEWIFIFFFWLFIAFIVKFTLDYRDYTTMKPIYLFPALLPFVYIFGIGLEKIKEATKKLTLFQHGLNAILILLLFLYTIDIAHLIKKLA
jgi:hypothetical protein